MVLLNDYREIEQSSPDADRWLAEHFGPAEHPGWLPGPVASWLALPHALLLEERVDSVRGDALQRLGLTRREREVLRAARAIGTEAEIADELFLSLHAVQARLERGEEKLGVRTLGEAIAAALRASL